MPHRNACAATTCAGLPKSYRLTGLRNRHPVSHLRPETRSATLARVPQSLPDVIERLKALIFVIPCGRRVVCLTRFGTDELRCNVPDLPLRTACTDLVPSNAELGGSVLRFLPKCFQLDDGLECCRQLT